MLLLLNNSKVINTNIHAVTCVYLSALSLHSLELLMNLPQFLLLFLNVSFDHARPLLQLILQVLHCVQLRRELHSESIE